LKIVGNENSQADIILQKLEAQLEEITHKKRLADNRTVFLTKKNSLQEYKKQMEDEKLAGNFEQTKCKISFASGSGYNSRDDEKFTISNTELILFFVDGLTLKIDEVVQKIEAELIG